MSALDGLIAWAHRRVFSGGINTDRPDIAAARAELAALRAEVERLRERVIDQERAAETRYAVTWEET